MVFDLTNMREKIVRCLCWCGAWFCRILTLCTIYKLPCVLLTNWGLPCGLGRLRGLGLEIGPICNFMKLWD